MEYDLNDIVEMKKEHPCHKSKQWKIIRMGADIRIKCLGCGTSILFPRSEFEKKLKNQGISGIVLCKYTLNVL